VLVDGLAVSSPRGSMCASSSRRALLLVDDGLVVLSPRALMRASDGGVTRKTANAKRKGRRESEGAESEEDGLSEARACVGIVAHTVRAPPVR
jgi:hypothetical protein